MASLRMSLCGNRLTPIVPQAAVFIYHDTVNQQGEHRLKPAASVSLSPAPNMTLAGIVAINLSVRVCGKDMKRDYYRGET